MRTPSLLDSIFFSLQEYTRCIPSRFFRYTVSGVIATIVHVGILTFLVELIYLNPTVSSAIGFIVACCLNYILQHYLVFSANGKHTVLVLRYVVVTLSTFVINIGLFWCLYHLVGVWYPAAQLIATGMIFLLNFFINRSYTFRNKRT